MNDLDRAVEEAKKALWAAEEAVHKAERDEEFRRIDLVVAAHEELVAGAAGLRRSILELHALQRYDPYDPNCGICFNSHGYEFNFPCPTYVLARDWSDT